MEGKVLHIVKNGYVILYWLKPSGTYEQICAVQSYSVTGALNLASNFLARFPPTANGRAIYVPNPTLPEDLVSLKASGMEIRQFRFLDQRLGGIDWEGLREDLMVSTILTTEGFWLT
jgi:aspartate/tyrosine/aromatic aminotransferase